MIICEEIKSKKLKRRKVPVKCVVENCQVDAKSKGFCPNHYASIKRFGRLERIRHKNKDTSCLSCDKEAYSLGYCRPHYDEQLYKNSTASYQKDHELYKVWAYNKRVNRLCKSWRIFNNFVKDVGPKPAGNFLFKRIDETLNFSINNFVWIEHLTRAEGETIEELNARRLKEYVKKDESYYKRNQLRDKFGITFSAYSEMLNKQNHQCVICGKPETAKAARGGGLKSLAVDHCHITGRVRELLCWRCNTTLGKIDEDVELLQNMIVYILKHRTAI